MNSRYCIITTPSKRIRESARSFLSGNWKTAVFALFIYYFILSVPVILYDDVFRIKKLPADGQVLDIAKTYDYADIMSGPSSLYSFALSAVFTLGIAMLFLSLVRGNRIQSSEIFNGFEYIFKAMGLFFVTGLFIFLWSLLLIVPGIIAAIRYSQAFYVLADHPEMNIMDCINESKRMMNGNKMKMFCLTVSFIGWAILAGLLQGLLYGLFSITEPPELWVMSVLSFFTSIPELWVMAYANASFACLYEMISGKPMRNIEIDADFVVMD